MKYLIVILFIGITATAITDLWALVRKILFKVALPNYGLVGRWVAYMARGRFYHEAITATPAVPGEWLMGWIFHYLTGIVFAALLIAFCGITWIQQPAIGPALGIGIATVAAPFLLMQPGMGAGIAASRTKQPGAARRQSRYHLETVNMF